MHKFDEMVEAQMRTGLDELSPDYHSVVYWCAVPLLETAKKYGTESDLPADYLDVLRRGAEGPIAMTTPIFTQPRFNDCYTLHLCGIARRVCKYFWNLEISAKGGTITTASAQKTPRLAGWFIGRNDRANEPATTVFVTAPKARDCIFVTTLKPLHANSNRK